MGAEGKAMRPSYRVIVTGLDDRGRSIVAEDKLVGEVAAGNFNFWRGGPAGRPLADGFPFFPPPGDSIFRFFRIPPDDPGMSDQDVAAMADGFFAAVGDAAARVDTSRHPLMHTTPTLDYVVLLSGEISLLLDSGDAIALRPLDAVVQRGTNHTWINTGREHALLLAVMIGSAP